MNRFFSFAIQVVVLLLFSLSASATDGICNITVNLNDVKADSAKVIVVNLEDGRNLKIKSYPVTGKVFTYDAEIPALRIVKIVFVKGAKEAFHLDALALPGKKLNMSIEGKEYFYGGDDVYEKINKADRSMSTFVKEKRSLSDEAMALHDRMDVNVDSLMEILQNKYADVEKQSDTAIINYVKANPESEGSAYLISNLSSGDQIQNCINLLGSSLRNGIMKPFIDIYEYMVKAEKAREEQTKNLAERKIAPDFTLKNVNGKTFKLSSLRGKYVVLDFWGTWCHWCVKGIPDMKVMYDKYSSKGLKLVSIDCNDTEAKWKEGVKMHKMNWINVYNPKDSKLTEDYAIEGFPTKIVVDPKGNIVKVIVGEDPAFYTFVDSLFE